jgi:hypothetical protein
VAEGLVFAGLSLPRNAKEAFGAVTRVLAGRALPTREAGPKMAGPLAANWHLLCDLAVKVLDHPEAKSEFQKAATRSRRRKSQGREAVWRMSRCCGWRSMRVMAWRAGC